MTSEQSLLALLSDGEWHSGEALAALLGVSRTAVWKQLNRLMDRGVLLERTRGRGYRLIEAPDILDRHAILSGIDKNRSQRVTLDVHKKIDSTNRALMSDKDPGSDAIRLCVADHQSAGRGRRGRHWISPPGENVYLSMGVGLTGGFAELGGLSLVVGLAVAQALESMGLANPRLKWPNDILVNARKLSGVLIELQGELDGAIRVVIGVGINVHMGNKEQRVDQPWISLDQASPDRSWQRNEIIAHVVNHVLGSLDRFERGGFEVFQAAWQVRDALFGWPLRTEPGSYIGLGDGVDQTGAYRLKTTEGEVLLNSGEISIRHDNESAD